MSREQKTLVVKGQKLCSTYACDDVSCAKYGQPLPPITESPYLIVSADNDKQEDPSSFLVPR